MTTKTAPYRHRMAWLSTIGAIASVAFIAALAFGVTGKSQSPQSALHQTMHSKLPTG